MAALLGPDFVSVQVRDFAVSRAFYTELLGFTVDPRFDMADFVLFDTSTILFALSEIKGDLDQAGSPSGGVTLWIDCDDVNALHAKLEEAGTTVIKPPFDSPFGRAFVFADPDGYQITANKPPWERFPLGGTQPR